ncbi:hypothetical protein D9M70_634340 [compost metagenome]
MQQRRPQRVGAAVVAVNHAGLGENTQQAQQGGFVQPGAVGQVSQGQAQAVLAEALQDGDAAFEHAGGRLRGILA